jgi:hypothetical protein
VPQSVIMCPSLARATYPSLGPLADAPSLRPSALRWRKPLL